MKKHKRNLLLILLVVAIAAPSFGNYREDHLYLGQYLHIRALMVWVPPMIVMGSTASMISTGLGQRFYSSSEMPDWDLDVLAGASTIDVDRLGIGDAGVPNTVEADVYTLHAGVVARKDRWTLRGTFHNEDIEGGGINGSGMDLKNNGVTLMPGYRVLTQEENYINLDVDLILDASYSTFTDPVSASPSGWYLRPGAKVSASHLCTGGLVQVAYAYNQLRSIDGDQDQFTEKKHSDSHALALDYAWLFTKEFWGNVGISHIAMDDMPSGTRSGIDEELTDVHVGLGVDLPGQVGVSLGYFQAIDGRSTKGFSLRGVWGIK